MIKAVNIAEDGKSAAYLAMDGGRGNVQLIPDPDHFNIPKVRCRAQYSESCCSIRVR